MVNLYKLRLFIADWLWPNDSGQPMIWFIKHFDSFKFESEEEAKAFIMTFAYIHSVYHFEGFVLPADDEAGYLSIDSFLYMHEGINENETLSEELIAKCKIIEDKLKATFLKLLDIFKSPSNLFREFVSMNIDTEYPSYKAYQYFEDMSKNYGYRDAFQVILDRNFDKFPPF